MCRRRPACRVELELLHTASQASRGCRSVQEQSQFPWSGEICMLIDIFQGKSLQLCGLGGSVVQVALMQKGGLILVDICSYCPDRYWLS